MLTFVLGGNLLVEVKYNITSVAEKEINLLARHLDILKEAGLITLK